MISALLSSPSIKEAAKVTGVGETTLHNRMKKPEFAKAYRLARMEMMRTYTAALQVHLGSAIQTITEIMGNKNNPAQVRLNAAELICRNMMKLTEQTDILERLETLEAEVMES